MYVVNFDRNSVQHLDENERSCQVVGKKLK